MEILDQIGDLANNLLGGSQGQANSLLNLVMQILGDSSRGGLSGLVQNFQRNGLGDVISSWIGTGQNLPISPDQLRSGLGGDTLQRLASQAGISPNEAGARLSQLLPNLIDKLTPGGQMPEVGALEQVLSALQSRIK